tara:strand:+ start:110 stop:475 length:366 start_codon:yes stop_codon:yes gene_type:complete
MAYPIFGLYGIHFLINIIIFIIALTTAVIILKKSKDKKKSFKYSSIVALGLLILSCIALLIPALGWDKPYLSFIRTVYYFIPMFGIFSFVFYKIPKTVLKYVVGIISLIIVDFLIYVFFIN